MSGKPAIRPSLILALTAALALPSFGQAASTRWADQKVSRPALLEFFESLLPEAVRTWFEPQGKSPARRGVTPKCGAGIDPDGKPCS